MSNTTSRLIKGFIGVVVVVVLLVLVTNWWGDYRKAASEMPYGPATSTVDSTKTASASQSTVVVLIDGLNFRKKPQTEAESIRGLKKGDKLLLVAKQDDWYQVKDSKGTVGWVAAKPQYVKVEK